MRFMPTLCAVALMTPLVGFSQTSRSEEVQVDAGSRVRIAAPVFGRKKQVGTVVSVTRDTLFLRHGASITTRPVATLDITALEVSLGTHTRKAKGALWGALIGAGAGAVLGYALYEEPKCDPGVFGCIYVFGPDTKRSNAAIGGLGGGIVGALLGTLIGTRATDTWVPGTLAAR